MVVAPRNSAHPLVDERTTWVPRDPQAARQLPRQTVRLTTVPGALTVPATMVREPAPMAPAPEGFAPRLLLQLAPVPRPITVETAPRRDFFVPVRYRDDAGWHDVVQAAA